MPPPGHGATDAISVYVLIFMHEIASFWLEIGIGHHACLSSWKSRVQSLVGPLLKILKIIEEEELHLH